MALLVVLAGKRWGLVVIFWVAFLAKKRREGGWPRSCRRRDREEEDGVAVALCFLVLWRDCCWVLLVGRKMV